MTRKYLHYIKLPGSNKQRNRARNLLKCMSNGDGSWLITGGESPHIVSQIGTELSCDCRIWNVENKLCSHIIKVKMELGMFPTKPIGVMK